MINYKGNYIEDDLLIDQKLLSYFPNLSTLNGKAINNSVEQLTKPTVSKVSEQRVAPKIEEIKQSYTSTIETEESRLKTYDDREKYYIYDRSDDKENSNLLNVQMSKRIGTEPNTHNIKRHHTKYDSKSHIIPLSSIVESNSKEKSVQFSTCNLTNCSHLHDERKLTHE